jgi:hypothetical protein
MLGQTDVSRVALAPSRSDAVGAFEAAGWPWIIPAVLRTLATVEDRS